MDGGNLFVTVCSAASLGCTFFCVCRATVVERKVRMMAKAKVTAADREKSGGGKGMRPGSFPVETKTQQENAIKLRGHAPDPSAVLDKVSRAASKTGDEGLKNRIAAARKKDRS